MSKPKYQFPQEVLEIAEKNIKADKNLQELIKKGTITRDDVALNVFVLIAPKYIIEQRSRGIDRPNAPVNVSDLDISYDPSFNYVAWFLGVSVDQIRKDYFEYQQKKWGRYSKK